ncbi:14775_t:CDS:10 [Cetraspora pellucida]|uniref:14775_t:CDS:1 n=1 Tax=Cetraspora pellucida TaxID=1433469 RepID=A0ACA9KA61_9GLOM|nr:14775_t:CDS:10 [Cetraspora pellucida]
MGHHKYKIGYDNNYPWSQRKLRLANPFPRFEHSASDVVANNELFIFGGNFQGQATNDVYVIETSTLNVLNFITSGDIPSPRTGHIHVNMGANMIVFGGLIKDPKTLEQKEDANLYILDTVTKKWKQLSVQSPSPGRHGHAVTVIGTKMYIFGGQTGESYLNDLIAIDTDVLQDDSLNASWELVAPKSPLPPGRAAHILCAHNNKIYMFGGMDGDRCYNDMWCYDLHNNTWSQLSCAGFIPFPRKYHSATIVDGIIYVFGGINQEGKELGDLTSFQINTQRWFMFQKMGPSPSPRHLHTMSAENEKVFVFGGESTKSPKPDEDGVIHILDTSRIKYPSQEPPQPQQLMLSQQQQQMLSQQQQQQQQMLSQQMLSQQQMSSHIPQQQQLPPQQQILQQQIHQQISSQQQIHQQQIPSQQQIHQQQQIMTAYSTSPTQQQNFAQRSLPTSPRQDFSPYGFNSSTSDNRIAQSPTSYQMSEPTPLPENIIYMERQRSNSPQSRSNANMENIRRQNSSPVTAARQSPTQIDNQRSNSNPSPKTLQRNRISTDGTFTHPSVMRLRGERSLESLRENSQPTNIRQQRNMEILGNNNNGTFIQVQGAPMYPGNPEFYSPNDFQNPRSAPNPLVGYNIQPDGFGTNKNNLMPGNYQPGMFPNTIYQTLNYPRSTNSYIESAVSSPTLSMEGHSRISDIVDHSSANIMNTEYNEFMKELEHRDLLIQTLRKREKWLSAELAIARKTGYTIDQVDFEGDKSEKVDLDQLIDSTDKDSENFPLLLHIAKVRQELIKSKANISIQAQIASQKITDSERIRTAALQEAAYFKAKLAALKSQSKSDLVILESERASELEKRLTKSLNEKESVQIQFLQMQQDLINEKTLKESAEERAKTSLERAEEAENSHARSLTELAALHSRATEAEFELRETKGQLLNSNIELKKLQNVNEQSQTQITSLQQSIDNLKRTLEKANNAMTTASKRASESEILWKQAQQYIANLEKESAGLRSQLDVRMKDLSRSAEKANNLEKMLEEERKTNITLREMMDDGVNKLLNNSLENSLTNSNDNSNMVQLEQEIAVLKNINEESQKSANEAANSLLSAKVKIVQMESVIMKARSENTSLQRQLAEASDEIIRTKGRLSEKDRILDEKSRILEDTEVKLGMMRDVMSERGILDDGSGNSAADKVKEMAARCEKLEVMHVKAQNDLKLAIGNYQEALKRVQEAENKSKVLEKELERTNALEMKNNELQKHYTEVSEKLSKSVNDYNTAMHYVQGTEKMLRRLKVELQNSKIEAAKLRTQLESMQKHNEELEEKLLEVQNRTSISMGAHESKIHEFANKQLELQREDFNKELSEIHQKMNQTLEEKKTMETSYKKLIKEHQQIKEDLEEALQLNDALTKQVSDAFGTQDSSENKQDNWVEQRKFLESQINMVRSTNNKLEKVNSELEQKLNASENRITILLDQMENTVDGYRNIEDNIKDTKSPRDSNSTDKDSENFPLLLHIAKVRQELIKSKANISIQAQIASQKITDSERIRTAALQEAAYFKAKLAALKSQSKSDLVILESERASELEKRLTKSLNEKESVQIQFLQMQQDLINEKTLKESAEERAKTSLERAEEAENSHARSLTELAALHSRATEAEFELRETKGQLLNSNIELKKLQNVNEQSQTQITSLQQSIDNLKRTLEKANNAMTTASKRASESEILWKQAQQYIANLEKESAGLRSQLDVRMKDLSRSAEKANNLEKMLEEERKTNITLREMMDDGVNKLLNNSLENSLTNSNDNSNMVQLEQEIAVLKNINEESQKSANEAANSLLSAKVKIVQMESVIMKARSENTSLQRQLAEASDEIIRTKGRLSEKDRILDEKSRILEDTEVKLGMMRDVMSERGILDDGSGNSAADKVKEMAARCEKLEVMHVKAQNDLKLAIGNYQEALKRVQEAENKSKVLEKELERTNALEMKNNELQKHYTEVSEKLSKSVNDYNTAMHYVQGTEKMLRRLKVELQNSKIEAAKLRTQLESMQKHNEELEEKLLEVQNRTSISMGAHESKIHEFANKQLELQREDFNKELSEIHQKMNQTLEEKKTMETSYKKLIKEHQQIKEDLEEALQLNDALTKQVSDAFGTQDSSENKQDNWVEQRKFLESQINMVRSTNNKLEKVNSELEQKLNASENRITILLDQMENTVDGYRNIEDNIKDTKSPRDSSVINALTDELNELAVGVSNLGVGGRRTKNQYC